MIGLYSHNCISAPLDATMRLSCFAQKQYGFSDHCFASSNSELFASNGHIVRLKCSSVGSSPKNTKCCAFRKLRACIQNDKPSVISEGSNRYAFSEDSKNFKTNSCEMCFSSSGLANAFKYAQNDANLLARQFMKLDNRAKKDVALIGSQFLFIDAKAKQDCEILDEKAKLKIEKIKKLAVALEESAKTELKTAADNHWNDGKLDEDLKLGDLRARRRLMEDTYFVFQVVRHIQNAVVNVLLIRGENKESDYSNVDTCVKEGNCDSDDNSNVNTNYSNYDKKSEIEKQIANFEESYKIMIAGLSEDIEPDISDSEELEFIISALLDFEGVSSADGAYFVTQCANSPDVETRRAIAQALAAAPSLCSLGNAGIGALQRLAKDKNELVAQAASKALEDLHQSFMQRDSYSQLLYFPGPPGSSSGDKPPEPDAEI